MRPASTSPGFSLVETLIVVALIGILALAAVPVLGSRDATKLDLAAVEVGNVMRLALSEANRTGSYVLVDASVPGRLTVVNSNASGANLGALTDPLNKRALELDASAPPWSGKIALAASFFQGGTAYQQLLIGPATQLQAFDAGTNRGPLQSGRGVALTLGSLSATVAIAETTGKVTIP
jgi:prepilin-type N-terminal cleavage/methylation domain-containing protein